MSWTRESRRQQKTVRYGTDDYRRGASAASSALVCGLDSSCQTIRVREDVPYGGGIPKRRGGRNRNVTYAFEAIHYVPDGQNQADNASVVTVR